jgi:hypothetical protein
LVSGIERERDESFVCQALSVETGGLFFHTARGVADHDRRMRAASAVTWNVEVAGNLQPGAVEGDVGFHDLSNSIAHASRSRVGGCKVLPS